MTSDKLFKVKQYHEEGLSRPVIAERLGTTQVSILRALRKLGLIAAHGSSVRKRQRNRRSVRSGSERKDSPAIY